ncbi:MAG: methyltransferase domain-containing protein [Candidatus Sedimenticola sp. PURPLELP]
MVGKRMIIIQNYKKHVMSISRAKKLEHFYSLCTGGKVLDVGVSGENRIEGENIFLETYRFPSETYTGLGVQDLSVVKGNHPDKEFLTYPGDIFPFDDNQFDWVFSNAVIEHVGNDSDQLRFVNEMMRVSKNVFFTTPNKYFPVESHTNAFFIHWLTGDYFYSWCAKNRPYWSRDNLYLFGKSRLQGLMEESHARKFEIQANTFFGWPMTFSVVCSN